MQMSMRSILRRWRKNLDGCSCLNSILPDPQDTEVILQCVTKSTFPVSPRETFANQFQRGCGSRCEKHCIILCGSMEVLQNEIPYLIYALLCGFSKRSIAVGIGPEILELIFMDLLEEILAGKCTSSIIEVDPFGSMIDNGKGKKRKRKKEDDVWKRV